MITAQQQPTSSPSLAMSTMLSSSASLPSSGSSSSLGRSSPDDVSTTLTSLAESAQYGPAVKLIVERAFFQSYPQVLQQNISVKDERIRELCHAHYQEFLASIDHLMAIKGEMAELKGSVRSLNEEVQASAAQLITAATAVNEQRRQRLRINEARDLVRQGQYLVQLTHKCNQQISKHKFFSAVKVQHTTHSSADMTSAARSRRVWVVLISARVLYVSLCRRWTSCSVCTCHASQSTTSPSSWVRGVSTSECVAIPRLL